MNDKMNMLSYYKIVIETVNIALYILKQFKIVLINNIERLAFEFFDIHFDPFINMSQLWNIQFVYSNILSTYVDVNCHVRGKLT